MAKKDKARKGTSRGGPKSGSSAPNSGSTVETLERLIGDYRSLCSRRPLVAILLAGYGAIHIFLLVSAPVVQFSTIPGLNRTIEEKNHEIQRLQTQLVPLQTIALQRYPGDPDALNKLTKDVENLQTKVENHDKDIISLKETLKNITKDNSKELNNTYKTYQISGIKGTDIIASDEQTQGELFIDWAKVSATRTINNMISITFGYIRYKTNTVINQTGLLLNQPGATLNYVNFHDRDNDIRIQIKVIDVRQDMTTIAIGVLKIS